MMEDGSRSTAAVIVTILCRMSDEKSEKPDPIEDVRKGLGLLFRAAKSTLDQLPTRQLEDTVVTGAREVGRAIESVTAAIDKQIFKRGATPPKAEAPPKADEPTPGSTDPHAGEPKGPRVE
jgi:hypothetical protein